MNNKFEIEIKSLLRSRKEMDAFLSRLDSLNPKLISTTKRYNDYYIKGDFDKLLTNIKPFLSEEELLKLSDILLQGKNHSIRAKSIDGEVSIVVKSASGNSNGHNGTARWEFEAKVPSLEFNQLNQIFLDSDFEIQARWSQTREDYVCNDISISTSFSPGYGYIVEFEKTTEDFANANKLKNELEKFMHELNLQEVTENKLDRMFQYYNKNWNEYYETDKVFFID